MQQPIVLWQIHDDKPGHLNQLRGLTDALAELLPLQVDRLPAPSRRSSLAALWSKKIAPGERLPAPQLILGAGHSTHLAMLAVRRAYGGRTIVLMKPSLPARLFDLCLVPEHDHRVESDRVVVTRGVLNVIRPSPAHDEQSGLLLIGGPSAAHGWSEQRVLEQITAVTTTRPDIGWQLTDSRRTPATLLTRLAALKIANLRIVPHQDTAADWVPLQLAKASQVWVSEDSVSMVYESLTSGAAVGLLEVPSIRRGRVAAGVAALVRNGWVTHFGDWQPGCRLAPPPQQLDEARRCAQIVCQRMRFRSAA
ncbi:MAG: mitochondrial fission ELM1 family protein [Bythopirellula sp.]